MPLLSKEERQTLTPDEKRAIRKERRAVRREERGPILGIKWEKLEPLAEDLILEIAGDLLPGEEKMQEVCPLGKSSVGIYSCPTLPRHAAVRPEPTLQWYVQVLKSTNCPTCRA